MRPLAIRSLMALRAKDPLICGSKEIELLLYSYADLKREIDYTAQVAPITRSKDRWRNMMHHKHLPFRHLQTQRLQLMVKDSCGVYCKWYMQHLCTRTRNEIANGKWKARDIPVNHSSTVLAVITSIYYQNRNNTR